MYPPLSHTNAQKVPGGVDSGRSGNFWGCISVCEGATATAVDGRALVVVEEVLVESVVLVGAAMFLSVSSFLESSFEVPVMDKSFGLLSVCLLLHR